MRTQIETERLGLLLGRELCAQDQRRLTRLLKLAHLKQNPCVEDIDYRGSEMESQ
ncbi:ATP-binding protein [Acidithiobacillus thiooxidans]|uniref:ATP-binding protein n=1 Tax=Acidithiobacillus thiooxidans TaxID=930 RepID=UPI003F647EA3